MRRGRKRIDYVAFVMIAPGVFVYALFVLLPVIIGLFYSFTNYNFSGSYQFIGFKNYSYLFQDTIFRKAVVNTFFYTVLTIVPQLIFGFLLAVAFNSQKLPGKTIYRACFYLPNVTSMVAISMVWLWIYDPAIGVLNKVMTLIGLRPVLWLGDPSTALGSLIVVAVWRSVGFNMIVNLAGLQGIPRSLYEAATIDGASKPRQLVSITVPMMAPTTFFLSVINVVNSFMVFEQVQVMTNGGPLDSTTTIVHRIYQSAFQSSRMGYAMSMAMILFLIVVTVTLLNFKFGRGGQDVEVE